MKIVLDTHIVLHAANGSLSPARTRLLDDEQNELRISAVSLWEITKLSELARIAFPDGFERFMRHLCAHPRYHLDQYDAELMIELREVAPKLHRDPADQIIVATARARGASLMTDDAHIRRARLVPVL